MRTSLIKFSLVVSLSCLVLSSCASLPRIVPELARQWRPPVQIKGARGALTGGQSKLILQQLHANAKRSSMASVGTANNIFQRHLALEQAIVGTPLSSGNEVILLQDGPATYTSMLAAIASAQNHINMETYIFDDDAVGQAFAAALIAKQRQGVQVNVIRDSVGTFTTSSAFFERLQASGINLLEFNPVNPLMRRKTWALNQRDHRKLLIVDGRVAFLGGINISSVYSGGSFSASHPMMRAHAAPARSHEAKNSHAKGDEKISVQWRDTDLRLRGPVVAEFQTLFLNTWKAQNGPPLPSLDYFPLPEIAGNQLVRAIGSAPEDPFSLIYVTLLSAIGNAERSIFITNAYFVPDPQLLRALRAAARRGVDVKLILPSQTDSWLVFHAGRAHYANLMRAGVKIYQRRGVILHSKTALIDGVWATVGSTNLDWRSFLHNQEVNAVVLGVEFGAQVQQMFEQDLLASEPITRERWRHRNLSLRIQELFARLWSYWL